MVDRIWMYPAGIYCQYPSGRVRVLSRDTMARFCTTGRYGDCPVYHRAQQQQCPFLRLRMAGDVYCRLPSGRVRIPSREELARFCSAGCYHNCPRFDRVRSNEMDLTGLM